jgi:hypothetical protein
MAISVLTAGGMGGARPSVGAFFGKPAAANDNAQKVSSNFISKDVIGSVLGNISGISAELKKIQQFSKDAIKSFERLVVDMRKLNNDITGKFKSVNTQIKKDNMDFLRSITRTYGDTLQSTGETAVNVPETAGPAAGAVAGGAAAAAGGSSVLDTVMGIGSTVADLFSGSKKAVGAAAAKETVKDVAKGASKPTLKAVVQKVVGSAVGKSIAKAIPGVALVAGVFDAASRLIDGDTTGAAIAAGAGLAANAPGVGTAAAIGLTVTNLARDIYKEYYGEYPGNDEQTKARLGEIVDMVKEMISGDVKDTKEIIKVGGEEVKQGEPLSDKQMMAMESAISMGNKYPDWLMEQYNKQKNGGAAGTGSKTSDNALPMYNPADKAAASSVPPEASVPPEVMRNWQLQFPEMVEAHKNMSDEDKSKVSKLFAEGNNSAAERMVAMRAGIEAAPTEKKLADTGRNISGRNLAATIKGTENNDAKQFEGVADKAGAFVSAATNETGGKPLQVKDMPPSAAPPDAPAEGGTPAAKEAGAPTNANPPAAATTGTPAKAEEDFSNLANVAGVQVEKGSDIPPKAMMALDAMMENDPQAAAKKYPAWVLEQYAKQNGNEAAPTGGATSQAAEIAGENVAGGGAGTGGDNGGTGGPSGDTGKADGAPEAASASPPNVPADLEPPSEANKNTAPIVMNNESSSSSGSVGGGEADKMSGQNLPLTAQNDALTEYFAKQNINYQ